MPIPIIQKIWHRKENDELELKMPNVINTDIVFQLMFGWPQDYKTDREIQKRHTDNYETKMYFLNGYEYDYIID